MKKLLILVHIILFIACTKPTRFERLSADETGIDFINAVPEKDSFNIMHDEYMYNGGGVGIVDLNNDSLPDIVFTGNKVSSKIYLNKGGFEFQDITSQFDNLTNDQWYSGVAIVDINNDGWEDIYLTSTSTKDSLKRKNRLWINQGLSTDGLPTFKEKAEDYGIADTGYSVHAGFFDYDLDGDLDLYILNNIVNKSVPTNYRAKIVDGSAINNDVLYRNEGNGKFTDVTKQAGIVYEGFGLGLAFGDINKDGYPDIYVSNDYISNDILYINQKDGTFKNYSKEYLSYQSRFSMGNDMVDVNNDGNLDIMTVDMMPEQYARKKQTINGNSYLVYVNNEKYGYEPQFVRNMFHAHNGFSNGKMLPLSEVGQMAGIFQTEWSWSPLFADFDNDGDRDLLITNGFPKDLTDKDFTNYKAQVYGFVAGDKHILGKIPIVKVSNYAYENTGPFSFVNQTKDWGMEIPSFSNGAAFTDLDNDGDLDYVVNNIDDEAFVYRNNTNGKLKDNRYFLRIKLVGKKGNLQAMGSKVELWSNGKYQYYEHFLTRGYISSVDPMIHFGLGVDSKIDSIRIRWPKNDFETVLKNVSVNRTVIFREEEAKIKAGTINTGEQTTPLFKEQKNLISYIHQEEDYVDFFQNQRILQHKLSQIGPCMAKGDLNGDGMEDLLVGGSKDSPSMVFLFQENKFVNTLMEGLTNLRACTESDMAILDIDGDGDNDVISISGGYNNEIESSYEHCLYENNNGSFIRRILPVPAFPGSVTRPFDYDHDGDMDLFIGARVKKGAYPFASESFILTNDNGKFSESQRSFNLGMVTDAVWSDFNGDGWEDLVITREWNSLVILESKNGKDFETAENNLRDKHGFWFSISAGDLDKDGDDDYIIGNLGENHRFNVSDDLPMRLYAIDIDKNSTIDPIASAYWKDEKGKMKEYPVNYLDELASQSPFFRKHFTSYTKFSYTGMDSILNRSAVADTERFFVNTTSSYILWNDKPGFVWEKLPAIVQTAPLKKTLIKDFNDDNEVDILLAGNDYSFDVSTGYFDANKGILLVGKGNKGFEVLPPSKSGLLLKGQVTSLLYFDVSLPFIVAGINRDSVVVFQKNGSKFSETVSH